MYQTNILTRNTEMLVCAQLVSFLWMIGSQLQAKAFISEFIALTDDRGTHAEKKGPLSTTLPSIKGSGKIGKAGEIRATGRCSDPAITPTPRWNWQIIRTYLSRMSSEGPSIARYQIGRGVPWS